MPIFKVEFSNGSNTIVNFCDTPQDAVRIAIKNRSEPIWCRLHDEMPVHKYNGRIGEMGFYHPGLPTVVNVHRMQAIFMDGGWCAIPEKPAS